MKYAYIFACKHCRLCMKNAYKKYIGLTMYYTLNNIELMSTSYIYNKIILRNLNKACNMEYTVIYLMHICMAVCEMHNYHVLTSVNVYYCNIMQMSMFTIVNL